MHTCCAGPCKTHNKSYCIFATPGETTSTNEYILRSAVQAEWKNHTSYAVHQYQNAYNLQGALQDQHKNTYMARSASQNRPKNEYIVQRALRNQLTRI